MVRLTCRLTKSTRGGGQFHLWRGSDPPVRVMRSTFGGVQIWLWQGSGSPVRVFRSAYGRDDQIYLRGELDSLVQVAK